MKSYVYLLSLLLFTLVHSSKAQQLKTAWNGKQCAVVLTYDDALNVHLDKVIPSLDSLGLKGTFYLIGESPVVSGRIDQWRKAAKNGHELGNHSLCHPCDANLQGRSWVLPENDLSKYTVKRAVKEIKLTNTLLKAIDGKSERTFAFPCGDTKIDTISFYKDLVNDFGGARGVQAGMQTTKEVDLNDIRCYMISGHSGTYMIDLVKKALETQTLIVFLFHGVGGEHSIDVSLKAHKQLIQYLKQNENKIWIAPMVEVTKYLKKIQNNK